jgi:peptidoglycan/LPS O-acetylase OafA/YrhL
MGAGSGRIDAVQALRAVAAMSVVVDHVLHEAAALDPGGTIQSWQTAAPWYSGVDVFFVISGFIMVHASRRLFGARDAPWRFLSHRLARIVPLYWAMTGLFVAVAMLDRRALNSDLSGAKQLVANLLFIPWPRPGGGLQPAFSLGWTLNFEMMFYVVFALFIWLPRPRALVCIGAVLAGLVAAHPAVPADWSQWAFWTDPVIAEFGFGMLVAVAAQAGWRLGRGGQAGLAVLAVVLLVGLYTAGEPAAAGGSAGRRAAGCRCAGAGADDLGAAAAPRRCLLRAVSGASLSDARHRAALAALASGRFGGFGR